MKNYIDSKVTRLVKKMTNVENDLDIYYAVGNTNTQRQENEIAAIIKNVILQVGG